MGSTEIEKAMPEPITVYEGPLRPADVLHQVTLIQEVMKEVMKKGEHYGVIPGCGNKPALLQPGAQVLALTFRLSPRFHVDKTAIEDHPGHREYMTRCDLVSIATGQIVGTGVGTCSTMESKYRYRNVADYEITGEDIPEDAREKKQEYRRAGFGMRQIDGVWAWVRYKDAAKIENPDIADTYNTVLKISAKRGYIHAVLNTTAASDMFTQDIDDLLGDGDKTAAETDTAAPATSGRKITKANAEKLKDLIANVGVPADTLAEILRVTYGGQPDVDHLTVAQGEHFTERLEAKQAELEQPEEIVIGPEIQF